MQYQIRLRAVVQKQLDKLTGPSYEASASAIASLEPEPRPPKVKKLADSGLWRVRVGHFRIIYRIYDEERLIIVVRIAKRAEDTYKGL
ncbi:MAG: type II toxin-antitoxin system RelE/ParE family toxin [Dehalococcoidales bacterium]|nr:type II toxin-antitoxin system RelE/ParE family toxin [Dehalococcoidales bacterium]